MHKDIDSHLSALDRTTAENERPMAHISAHNAVDCPTDAKIVAAGLVKKEKLDAMYEKARKRAEKNGTREKMLDRRDERSSAAVAG
ncbi:MAG: hypothetical protein L6R38_001557, partial [Xanthoria sp. 2 TBL-2021]